MKNDREEAAVERWLKQEWKTEVFFFREKRKEEEKTRHLHTLVRRWSPAFPENINRATHGDSIPRDERGTKEEKSLEEKRGRGEGEEK